MDATVWAVLVFWGGEGLGGGGVEGLAGWCWWWWGWVVVREGWGWGWVRVGGSEGGWRGGVVGVWGRVGGKGAPQTPANPPRTPCTSPKPTPPPTHHEHRAQQQAPGLRRERDQHHGQHVGEERGRGVAQPPHEVDDDAEHGLGGWEGWEGWGGIGLGLGGLGVGELGKWVWGGCRVPKRAGASPQLDSRPGPAHPHSPKHPPTGSAASMGRSAATVDP